MKILRVAILFAAAILATCSGSSDIMPFKEQCLYWHNYFRTLHQVPNVTWSTTLQKQAENWVKYLAKNDKFHHEGKNPGNLYMSGRPYPKEYCSDALWWFHEEEKSYNFKNPGFVKAAGHFTQVVWKGSIQIGAAWAIRKDKSLVLSIKYSSRGNIIRYFEKNVLPPTAALLPGWSPVPPKFTRCPIAPPTNVDVLGAAGRLCQVWSSSSDLLSLQL
ncbi:hypothetical protein OS493_012134 [Desmophyllum pertusum]|uniref:SCP domain-containing protein n=1 Tax=Desmophyllum pertusum TaxID=174260 RepID=A0A9X0A3N2_9CNID|nr:hypothetical protein OS493_012134 [Desmophyllum pertusum]